MQEYYYLLKLGNLYVERFEIDGNYTKINFDSDISVALEFSSKEVEIKKSLLELCLGVELKQEVK